MRLDVYLVQNGYFESRNKAASAVKEKCFSVNDKLISKPSYEIAEGDCVCEVKCAQKYVARSAYKLLRAYDVFSLNLEGKTAVDLGASTGGFCQVLLEKGAKKVFAVDIGTAQLHPKIAGDARIVNLEHTNARYLNETTFSESIDVVTADLSFISIKLILSAIFKILAEDGQAIVLIKPQFEAGPAHLNKSGVVTERKVHKNVLLDVTEFAKQIGFSVCGVDFSGLAGESGNREYLIYLKKTALSAFSLEDAIEKAVYSEE